MYLSPTEQDKDIAHNFLRECLPSPPPPSSPTPSVPSATSADLTDLPVDLPRHPPPAPRSMQRRYQRPAASNTYTGMAPRSVASDFFDNTPSSRPTTGDRLMATIHRNLLPMLSDDQNHEDFEGSPGLIATPTVITSPDPNISSFENIDTETPAAPTSAPEPALVSPPSLPLPPMASPPCPSQHYGPNPPLDPQLSTRLTTFRETWTSIFSTELPWDEFATHCGTFTSEARDLATDLLADSRPRPAPRNNDRPTARRPPNGRPFTRFDGAEAQRLQSLYRHSKKRAGRKILSNDSPSYSGSVSEVENFFTNMFGQKPCDTAVLQRALDEQVPSADIEESLFNTPTAPEISKKLRSAANTCPGPDRVEYRHLKRVDPSCKILELIFAHCFEAKDVPAAWKSAATILIHKKGPTNDAANFRPIALMSCVYKLLMGVIAKRLSSWAIENDILSSEQKSARPSEGCYEHTFLLQSFVGDARRHRKDVYLAWLDLRNAFGSIPHPAIRTTLTHIGVPASLVDLVMNAYTGATTTIRTPIGDSNPVQVQAGVKQGCPLSPILFNLCIELILRSAKSAAAHCRSGPAKHHGTPLSTLAYADDLVFVARKKATLESTLAAATKSANLLGLSFRPDKCASLSIIHPTGEPVRCVPNEFVIQRQPIPALQAEEMYRYLGIPIGLIHNCNDLPSLVPKLTQNLEKINSSALAPWQKLDAIRTFVQPCLTFALRAGNPLKKSLETYKTTLVRVLRQICSLPSRSTVPYFFAHKSAGGLGLQDPLQEVDVQTVTQALKILSSPDPVVAAIARAELHQTVRHAAKSLPTPALVSNYLSALPDDRLEHITYRIQSLWTRARKAARRMKIQFTVPDNNPPAISTNDSGPIPARDACRFLHHTVQSQYAEQLQAKPDQGKVSRTLANDLYSNGSTWQFTGLNLRFRDWRFIHKARLNCTPLNSAKSRWSNTSPRCRHCNDDETLPHVLCHCRPNMVAIRARHDKVVARLTNAIRFGEVITDRTVADSDSSLRPDIIIKEGNRVVIIDVCCPFENGPEALRDAEQLKIAKYEPLKQHFQSMGSQCEVFGFPVGALGSWHPGNEIVLRRLGMTKSYKSLFRKLCCTDVIQSSSDIYRQHLGIPEVNREAPVGPQATG